jgi:hypothetical protein
MLARMNLRCEITEKLTNDIKTLPDDAMVSFPLKDGGQSEEFSVKDIRARLGLPAAE